jgi:metal-responsive CopG/Arc/MetJ family transcriptional regulator
MLYHGHTDNAHLEVRKMPNVKTAISIEKPIFEQMDTLAKQLNISRSRLFTMAAREFIERYHNIELLKKINAAYEDASETEPIVSMMHSNHYKMVKDQW